MTLDRNDAMEASSTSGTLVPTVRSVLATLSKPLSFVGNKEITRAKNFVESAKIFVRWLATNVIIEAGTDPVVIVFSGDGTPVETRHRAAVKMGDYDVRRSGYGTNEYYIQQAMIRRIAASGKTHTAMVLSEPIPLVYGKSHAAQMGCSLKFFPTVRELGHQGIVVSAYIYDRAFLTSNGNIHCQHHQKVHAELEKTQHEGRGAKLLFLMDWVVTVGCSLHDCSNAVKWSLHMQFRDAQLMRDLYIVIASARNSYNSILKHLIGWLRSGVLEFAEDGALPSQETLLELYSVLGVDPYLTDKAASVLQMVWKDGKLMVRKQCMGMPEFGKLISGVLLGLWSFKLFSTSRWVGVGTSCRVMVLGWLTGLSAFMHYMETQGVGERLHGYAKLTRNMKRFVVKAALSSNVPESVQIELMADACVPKKLDVLEQCAAEELELLCDISNDVWEILAGVCDLSYTKLRQDTIRAGHVSLGFLYHRIFLEAKKLPWSLCVGDIPANVQKLVDSPCPVDPVSKKIWTLWKMGQASQADIVRALELMSQIPWSTKMAEEQHASSSIIAKAHPEYDSETVRLRSFIHTFLKLMPGVSEEEKAVERSKRRLSKLLRKNPNYITGRQLYFKEVVGVATGRKVTVGGKDIPRNVQQVIMKRHGARWRALTDTQRAHWEQKAKELREVSWAQLESDLEDEESKLSVCAARLEDASASKDAYVPMNYSACKLEEEDLEQLQNIMMDHRMQGASLEAERTRSQKTPVPLLEEEEDALKGYVANLPPKPLDKPSWLSKLCWNREEFDGCVIEIAGMSGTKYFLFLIAIRSPYQAMFAPMHPFTPEPDEDLDMTPDQWWSTPNPSWTMHFNVSFNACVDWAGLEINDASQVSVIPGLLYQSDKTMATVFGPTPWADFTRHMLARGPETGEKKVASSSSEGFTMPDFGKKPLWLVQLEREEAKLRRMAKGSSIGDEFEALDPSWEDGNGWAGGVPDEYLDRLCDVLEAKRISWGLDVQGDGPFQMHLLGGPWLEAEKGILYDAFSVSVQESSPAWKWCSRYKFGRSARFEISAYSEEGSYWCAREWKHKAEYYYQIWREVGVKDYKYTEGDVAGYVALPEFVAYYTNPGPRKTLVHSRLRWLRDLAPQF